MRGFLALLGVIKSEFILGGNDNEGAGVLNEFNFIN